jgi:all-trans-retinol 13,14-reductase
MNTTAEARPWSKTSSPGPWDDIVIGSGMGGMCAAAFLAQLGRRVLVLEQHYVAGGFTHTFRRREFRWDVGVHAVGEVTEKSLPGRLLARLTRGALAWRSLGPVYDEFHFPDGVRIDFPDDPRKFRENLLAAFPNERAAIDEYLGLVREISRGMRAYYLARIAPPAADRLLARRALANLERRTGDVIGRLSADPRFKAALVAQWGYYGSPPARSSFAIQALVAKHFLFGGYYPVGGSEQIARTLLSTVRDAGGWTRIHADVAEIVVENDRAAGVRLQSGELLRSKRVVSAAGAVSTVKRLLPEPWKTRLLDPTTAALRPAPAHACLYLGFEGDIRSAGTSAANKWFYESWEVDREAWEVPRDAGAPLPDAPCLYSSFPSLKDPAHDPGPRQLHTGEVVTFVPWETFAPWRDARWRKRGAEYDELKARMEEKLKEQFLRHLPGLRPFVKYAELSTPVSTDHFVRPESGSIYGLEPTPERFKSRLLRPRSPIRGLFFAGSDIATVGVIGAMMGGILAVVAAEPVAALAYLKRNDVV